jgi:hypothetical protein
MNKMRDFSAAIDRLGGGDYIWGWIGGTAQRICRPIEEQRKVYNGHKKVHVLKGTAEAVHT